jgi:hypothetical protein
MKTGRSGAATPAIGMMRKIPGQVGGRQPARARRHDVQVSDAGRPDIPYSKGIEFHRA